MLINIKHFIHPQGFHLVWTDTLAIPSTFGISIYQMFYWTKGIMRDQLFVDWKKCKKNPGYNKVAEGPKDGS